MSLSCRCRSRGFTLIELLVVIGIIGILAGVLLATFGGASESAKAAKCMTNMRNLAVAVHTAAMADENGYFPAAGAYEYLETDGYAEVNGWISWNRPRPPKGANPYARNKVRGHRRGPRTTQVSSSWTTYLAYRANEKADKDIHHEALTNGVVWLHSGRNAESYVCPSHLEWFRNGKNKAKTPKARSAAAEAKGYTPCWSYVMNSYFGYDNSGGKTMAWQRKPISGLTSLRSGNPLGADKVLLFAEVPFDLNCELNGDVGLVGDGPQFDSVLQYAEKSEKGRGWGKTPEYIGFNHKAGKRWMGHVAFADGHVARLMLPRSASVSKMQELTTWLCQGDDVAFQGDEYQRTSQVDDKLN